ncbi:hypothetical protein M408DRAFT_313019 [Serendipita vermifera MAFF 305830]|uniref:Uncharacterized protein n=1 Tax=Serendipita vermifera MAFF 305830 TaxID=933852 RepID=A0A0C3BMZ0_SERVB|nr:hypothetical protein M408DRAFT_313019 [Serendipita vermifera MAFF 305830]
MRYNHEGRKPRFTENPHFTLDEARRTLTIHATDVSNTVRFTPELPTSKQAKDWKGKIGDRLCRRFLYLGGEGPKAKQRPINEDEEKQWKAYQDKECKRNFEELNKRTACQKSGETYKAPPTPVDHFNEDMYLLPAIERL